MFLGVGCNPDTPISIFITSLESSELKKVLNCGDGTFSFDCDFDFGVAPRFGLGEQISIVAYPASWNEPDRFGVLSGSGIVFIGVGDSVSLGECVSIGASVWIRDRVFFPFDDDDGDPNPLDNEEIGFDFAGDFGEFGLYGVDVDSIVPIGELVCWLLNGKLIGFVP